MEGGFDKQIGLDLAIANPGEAVTCVGVQVSMPERLARRVKEAPCHPAFLELGPQ